jgi:hypothetical protein
MAYYAAGTQISGKAPMRTRKVVRTDAGKLKMLRASARVGVTALDRGDFKEFGNVEELRADLSGLSEKVISKADPRS